MLARAWSLALVSGAALASCNTNATGGSTFTLEPSSSIEGSLRLVLTVAPASASPGGALDISLTGIARDASWSSATLSIDLPPEIEHVSGELTWTGPLKAGASRTLSAKGRLTQAKLARIRGSGSCSSPTPEGSVSWSGSAFFVVNRQLLPAPQVQVKPEHDPGLQKILDTHRYTRQQLLDQQAKGGLTLPLDIPDRVTVSRVKLTYWESLQRPEVRALFHTTVNGKTLEGSLYADGDSALPALLFEEHRADGSYYARGLVISSFGWNPELFDVEWLEFRAFEYREPAPSRAFPRSAAPEAEAVPR